MKDKRLPAAIGGFAFVAAWIGFSFGEALLCLAGAVVCWVAVAVIEGSVDLGELQGRFTRDDEAPAPPVAPARPVRRQGRARVR